MQRLLSKVCQTQFSIVSIVFADSTKKIPAFRFDAMLPSDKTKYFRYDGSLTTPTCNEVVTWTVFNDAVKISKSQVYLVSGVQLIQSNPH